MVVVAVVLYGGDVKCLSEQRESKDMHVIVTN
jgi:hypothetical protein